MSTAIGARSNPAGSRSVGPRVGPTVLLAILGAAMMGHAVADTDVVLRGGYAYSDNILRLPDVAAESSASAVAGLVLRGERPEGRLRYSAVADIAYFDYLDVPQDSELLGRAVLSGTYDFLQDSVAWNAQLTYDQSREDLLRPLAPGNRIETVSWSTGPTLRARLSGPLELVVDPRISRQEFGGSLLDSETRGGRVLLTRRATPQSLLGVGYAFDDVRYQAATGSNDFDFQRQEGFARASLEGRRTQLDLEVGYTSISGPLVDDSGALFRARLTRTLSPALTAYVNAIQEYPTSNTTLALADPTLSGGGAYDQSLLTAAPRQVTSLEAGVRFERARTQALLAYSNQKQAALVISLGDRRYEDLRFRISRRLTPGVTATVHGTLVSEDFPGSGQSFDEQIAGVDLLVGLGRTLGLELRVQHQRREAGISASGEYSELSGGVALRYTGSFGRTERERR